MPKLQNKLITLTLLVFSFQTWAAESRAVEQDWVKRSNAIAYKILESGAKFAPEFSGQSGVEGYDEEIFDLKDNLTERQLKNSENNLKMLREYLAKEQDSRVKQDIEIMIQSVKDSIESTQINEARVLPYGNVIGLVFAGFNGQLDKQVPFERQQAALVRLKKYTGQAKGYEPLVELAKKRLTERMHEKDLIKPFKGEVEQDIQRSPTFIKGLSDVFSATDLTGYEADLKILQQQLSDYNDWVKANILPNTRESAMLPRELYELQLKNYGVDATPEELMKIGQTAFMNIRFEMMALAPLVAEKMGYESSDYREVMELLKAQQVQGEVALMNEYAAVMRELDQIITRHELISLPNEPARARMATAAETAQQPAAHLDVPRLVGNTGEFPEFIVPKIEQNEDGSWPKNDYAFKAMMWTLAAHEARPGHEMQFTTMLRGGVSTARAMFAFNSANVEGWALYAEAISKQYMPLEGQLYSLQARLLRAARIWLDPMLNLGLITPAEAKRVLMEDVGEDDLNAQTEIDRYTFRSPAQATAYYYGYEKLLMLRAATELKLKDQFNQKNFHDFILKQGLLPPALLKKTVDQDFIEPMLKN